MTGALGILQSIIGAALSVVGTLWVNAWTGISTFFGGLWSSILGIMSGAGTILVDVGKNLIQGFLDGITNAWKWVERTIRDLFGGAVDLVKGILGIHSPSRVFMEIGGYTAEGMALGMEKNAYRIEEAAELLIPKVPSYSSASLGIDPADPRFGGGVGDGSTSVEATFHVRTDDDPRLWARGVGDELSKLMAGAR